MKTVRTVRSKPVNYSSTGYYFKYGEQFLSNDDMTEKVVYMPSVSVPYCKPNVTGVGTLAVCTSTGVYIQKMTITSPQRAHCRKHWVRKCCMTVL